MDKTKQKSNTSSFFGKVHEYLQSDFFDEEEKLHTSRKAKLYTLLFVLVIILIVGSRLIYEHRFFCEQQKIIVERMQQRSLEAVQTFFEQERNTYYDDNCNLYFGNPEGVHDPR